MCCMYALHACMACMYGMDALHVCNGMCVLQVCTACVYCRYVLHVYGVVGKPSARQGGVARSGAGRTATTLLTVKA